MVRATFVAASLILAAAGLSKYASASHNVFHGALVNTAKPEREDPWWQQAEREESLPRSVGYRPIKDSVIVRGDLHQKIVALTFDDGPHPGKVQELLTLLNRLHVKATFFVVGKMVERNPQLVRMEARAGHEIANHSFSHVNLTTLSPAEVRIEYRACSDLLKAVLGKRPRFCRPPGGQATPAVTAAASSLGMKTVMWTDDPKDYSNPGDAVIVERTVRHLSNGGILLFHEGVDETLDILPDLVNRLRSEGYRFVTLAQIAKRTAAPKLVPIDAAL